MQTPSAFAAKKVGNGFAPPPVRRVPAHVPEPEPEPEPEQDFQAEGGEEATGQWAEALYDYMSKVRRCLTPPFLRMGGAHPWTCLGCWL